MIAMIEHELGFPLYDSVAWLKRTLSEEDRATFRFSGAGVEIEAAVSRAEFESWIAGDMARIAAAVDQALANAGIGGADIDRVFLTGGRRWCRRYGPCSPAASARNGSCPGVN